MTIDSVSRPNERKLRNFVFHDASGAKVRGLLLHTVTTRVEPGQKFQTVRGIVHQPRANEYEVIIEMDKHLSAKSRHEFRVSIEGLEFSVEDAERITRAVQKVVLTELSGMDIAPRFGVRFIGNGGTQGIEVIAQQEGEPK